MHGHFRVESQTGFPRFYFLAAPQLGLTAWVTSPSVHPLIRGLGKPREVW